MGQLMIANYDINTLQGNKKKKNTQIVTITYV